MSDTHSRHPNPIVDDRTVELIAKGAKIIVVAVNAIVLVTLIMLSLGFVLLLAGASSDASFVDWVYRNIERSMAPFRGMFPVREFDGKSVFDPSLLFAAVIYGIIALGLQVSVAYLTGVARSHHRGPRSQSPAPDASHGGVNPRSAPDATDPLVTFTGGEK